MHGAQSQNGTQTEGRTKVVQDAEPNPAPPDGIAAKVTLLGMGYWRTCLPQSPLKPV
jgi:hypothetical protein